MTRGWSRVALFACAACGCGRSGFGPADALAVGDVRLVHGFSPTTSAGTLTRVYHAADATWSDTEDATPAVASSQARWVVPRVAPIGGDELIAVASTSGASTTLAISSGPPGGFAVVASSPAIPVATVSERGFDLAIETSGDALVAYTDGTAVPKYRTRAVGTDTWNAETAVPGPAGMTPIVWIQLVARPRADEIALIYADQSAALWVVVWTGETWGAPTQLDTKLRATEWKCFDAVYEQVSGDLLVAWGRNSGAIAGFVWSAKLAGQSTFSPPIQDDNALVGPGIISLAAEHGSDRVALAMIELTCGGGGCDNLATGIWDGAGWTGFAGNLDGDIGTTNADQYGSRTGSKSIAVAWLGTTGTAIALYGRTSNALDWGRWTVTTGWVLQPPVALTPPVSDKSSIELVDLDDSVLAVFSDVTGALWSKRYDGTGWQSTEGGAALDTTVGFLVAQPFGIVRR